MSLCQTLTEPSYASQPSPSKVSEDEAEHGPPEVSQPQFSPLDAARSDAISHKQSAKQGQSKISQKGQLSPGGQTVVLQHQAPNSRAAPMEDNSIFY